MFQTFTDKETFSETYNVEHRERISIVPAKFASSLVQFTVNDRESLQLSQYKQICKQEANIRNSFYFMDNQIVQNKTAIICSS